MYGKRKGNFVIVTEPNVTVSDLQPDTKYEFRIAVDESVNGTSAYSDILLVHSPKGSVKESL